MARVTVEDCIPVVNNRFELVLYAAERSRAIARGSEITVQKDDDKDSVVALREIADGNLDLGALQEGIVRALQKHFERDETDEDPVEAYARSLGLDTGTGDARCGHTVFERGRGRERAGRGAGRDARRRFGRRAECGRGRGR